MWYFKLISCRSDDQGMDLYIQTFKDVYLKLPPVAITLGKKLTGPLGRTVQN